MGAAAHGLCGVRRKIVFQLRRNPDLCVGNTGACAVFNRAQSLREKYSAQP